MKEKTYNDLLEEIVSIRRTITVRNDMIKYCNSTLQEINDFEDGKIESHYLLKLYQIKFGVSLLLNELKNFKQSLSCNDRVTNAIIFDSNNGKYNYELVFEFKREFEPANYINTDRGRELEYNSRSYNEFSKIIELIKHNETEIEEIISLTKEEENEIFKLLDHHLIQDL